MSTKAAGSSGATVVGDGRGIQLGIATPSKVMWHMELEDLVPITVYLGISLMANPSIEVEIQVPR